MGRSWMRVRPGRRQSPKLPDTPMALTVAFGARSLSPLAGHG